MDSRTVAPAPFRDPTLTLTVRVEDLMARLTRDEKVALLHQRSPAVARLGVEAFRTGTEALHGVAWFGVATVFPQAVGLGATWNPDLLQEIGAAVGAEARAKRAAEPTLGLNVWAPVVNLLRDPRWGRNEEGYSEDVVLTVRLATAYCRGLAGPDPDHLLTAPLLKHFLAYNNEDGRTTTSSVVRLRVLHEYDLPVFTRTLRDGFAVGVMPSYNRVNGRPSHTSPLLRLLRDEICDDLLICSDAEATANLVQTQHWAADHAAGHAAALRAGVDNVTDQEESTRVTLDRFEQALAGGLITMADVERAVRRLLLVRLRLGEFDPEPAVHPTRPTDLDHPDHRVLARRAAREQTVLLRNDLGLLPLARGAGLRVAVIGPFGDQLREDWYSGTMPYRITVAAGLRAALEPFGGTVTTACGRDLVQLVIDGRPAGHYRRSDWGGGVLTLADAATGRYLTAVGDGSLAATSTGPSGWVVQETLTVAALPDGRGGLLQLASQQLVGVGPDGELRLDGDPAPVRLELVADGVAEALAVAAAADVVLLVLGNEPMIIGRETQDRTGLALPPDQQRLLEAIAARCPSTVLVLMSSYPYSLGAADPAVRTALWTSHAGQETGAALAELLLGVHAPSGRLPQTWYRTDADLPDLLDYDIIKARRTYQYLDVDPLFPFGHGLTYTSFEYGPATAEHDESSGSVTVTVPLANTGLMRATEVVQVYARARSDAPDLPRRRLLGFARVTLDPAERGAATLRLHTDDLALYDVAQLRMRVWPGDYELLVARSAERIESTVVISVPGEPVGLRPLAGPAVSAAAYDDCEGTTLVETTALDGDSLALADGHQRGWALFRAVDLRPVRLGTRLRVRCGRTGPGSARLSVHLHSATGPLLAEFAVPSTGDPHAWVQLDAACLVQPPRTADVWLVLDGEQRVDTFGL